ncbi:MAG: glycosyltransferase family 2 protein [Acidobacteria bacterium]|nr:glycosyltransferase family 2 protein [Acidobacteriota bacterium]
MNEQQISAGQDIFLSVVIPAYNEAERIGATVCRVVEFLGRRVDRWEMVVVDDGSTDGTAQLVRNLFPSEHRLRVLQLSPNHGKGHAVRVGMLAAEGDLILFSDADLSAPIEEVERLLPAVLDSTVGGYDVAFGSRALKREWIEVHQSMRRELAGKCFNLALRVLTGLNYRDTQCGFKLFRRAAARAIFSRQQIIGFGFDPEVLFLARKLGLRAIEVPVRWAHNEGSKVRVLRDGIRMVVDLLRIRGNDLTGKYAGEESKQP